MFTSQHSQNQIVNLANHSPFRFFYPGLEFLPLIPIELWDHILSYIDVDNNSNVELCHFYSARLVCTAWKAFLPVTAFIERLAVQDSNRLLKVLHIQDAWPLNHISESNVRTRADNFISQHVTRPTFLDPTEYYFSGGFVTRMLTPDSDISASNLAAWQGSDVDIWVPTNYAAVQKMMEHNPDYPKHLETVGPTGVKTQVIMGKSGLRSCLKAFDNTACMGAIYEGGIIGTLGFWYSLNTKKMYVRKGAKEERVKKYKDRGFALQELRMQEDQSYGYPQPLIEDPNQGFFNDLGYFLPHPLVRSNSQLIDWDTLITEISNTNNNNNNNNNNGGNSNYSQWGGGDGGNRGFF